jgi:hypothetical protein
MEERFAMKMDEMERFEIGSKVMFLQFRASPHLSSLRV